MGEEVGRSMWEELGTLGEDAGSGRVFHVLPSFDEFTADRKFKVRLGGWRGRERTWEGARERERRGRRKEKETDRQRNRDTEKERERQRGRARERDRERQRQRQREREERSGRGSGRGGEGGKEREGW